jgi:hypothetical protein
MEMLKQWHLNKNSSKPVSFEKSMRSPSYVTNQVLTSVERSIEKADATTELLLSAVARLINDDVKSPKRFSELAVVSGS